MAEYRYTRKDRLAQLRSLERSLLELLPVVEATPHAISLAPRYRDALEQVRTLLCEDFSQDDLSSLSMALPDVFHRHKDWIPPLELSADGQRREPDWFIQPDAKLIPVLDIAAKLREMGFY